MNAFMKLLVPVVLLAVAGCAKDKTRGDDSTSGTPDSSATTPYGTTTPSAGSTSPLGGGGTGAIPTGKVVYFEFDSSDINAEGQAVVDGWASYLSANAGSKVRLEGHCDERGTREYNVALGERRANAVLQALTSRGVSERQISVSSFGEERPVASGHDEASWQQNRRVEVVQ